MTGQAATLGHMEPIALSGSLARVRDTLRRQGIDPDAIVVPDDLREPTPEDAREMRALQAANKSARWRHRLPVMYADAALADLDDRQHLGTISSWLGEGSSTLVLAGNVGSGKTHAAYAVGHAAVAAGLWVEAWTLADLLEALRPGGDPTASDHARRCDLLILDDLMATRASEWAVEQVTTLLDHRLRNRGRQIVTTNVDAVTLEEAWGARAMDRLRFRWTVCTFTGPSRRAAGW